MSFRRLIDPGEQDKVLLLKGHLLQGVYGVDDEAKLVQVRVTYKTLREGRKQSLGTTTVYVPDMEYRPREPGERYPIPDKGAWYDRTLGWVDWNSQPLEPRGPLVH